MERPRYNNPAGRLLSIFERAQTSNGQQVRRPSVAKVLGTTEDLFVLISATVGMHSELLSLKSLIERSNLTEAIRELYDKQMPAIEQSVLSFRFIPEAKDLGWQWQIQSTAVVALQFMAAQLDQEPEASDEALESIRSMSEELRSAINDCASIPFEFKTLLLELVRLIRDSVDQYAIRGNQGVRESLARVLGELFLSQECVDEVKSQSPTVWQLMSYVGLSNQVATTGRNSEYLLENAGGVRETIQQVFGP
jgi:hypothetical protein